MSSILERILRGEKVNHFETKRRRKDGEIIDVSVTISPIAGRNGVIARVWEPSWSAKTASSWARLKGVVPEMSFVDSSLTT